jgi:type I restriction enzyme R subunit
LPENKDSKDDLSYLAAIADYNADFNTTFDTSAEKFENYYKDVSLRMKRREVDLLVVVNMFLTGFDAIRPTTCGSPRTLSSMDLS